MRPLWSATPVRASPLGTTKNGLKANWLRAGWLKPAPYTQGRRRFLVVADVERAKAARARVAGSRRLFTLADAARYLRISPAHVERHRAVGQLSEAMPGSELFARVDLDRLRLLREGIADPISKAEAARLAHVPKATFEYWIEAGRVEACQVGRFLSKAAVLTLVRKRDRELATLRREMAAGRLLRTNAAARRLGVSEVALFQWLKRGVLRLTRFPLLRRTFLRAAEVERVRRARLVKRRGR